jgi:predicted RNA-binding protein (virulence factor B family)
MQTLVVIKKASMGVYLGSREDDYAQEILLPAKQVPPGTEELSEIEVFVYRDSEDRLIATTTRPKLVRGEVAALQVKQVTNIGAFLDWGLPKDLFLPYKEQTIRVTEGKEYIVGLYVDNSNRLSATMRVYDFLSSNSPYHKGDRIQGLVYKISEDLGALVAVDNKYNGLVPKAEIFGQVRAGQRIEARVVRVREDGKLDLSFREEAGKQMDADAELLLSVLAQRGGSLPLHDKSTPEEINAQLRMSKGAFKKAVGRLLKEGKINITDTGIELKGT